MTRLNWGMVGGGDGSQIGPAHRLGAGLDGAFSFVAGALDHNPEAGRAFAQSLGIAADRAYGDWREMLAGEAKRRTATQPQPHRKWHCPGRPRVVAAALLGITPKTSVLACAGATS